jgi:hypothetical protein
MRRLPGIDSWEGDRKLLIVFDFGRALELDAGLSR